MNTNYPLEFSNMTFKNMYRFINKLKNNQQHSLKDKYKTLVTDISNVLNKYKLYNNDNKHYLNITNLGLGGYDDNYDLYYQSVFYNFLKKPTSVTKFKTHRRKSLLLSSNSKLAKKKPFR